MPRILIVEDTPEIAEALRYHLERRGHQALVATRAAEALLLASAHELDAVVLDLGLPDRDGYSVLDEMRNRGNDTPVLILSARQEEADKLQGFRLGADDYVTKPFSALELLERVAALLRRPRTTPQPPSAPTAPAELTDDELKARFGLTARQVKVARLLGQGLSNAEVARALVISENTARNHTYHVLTRMGTSKRGRVGAILRGAIGTAD